jgi:hypothetical protein
MTTHCQNLVEALHSTVAESNKSIGHQHPLLMNDAVMQVSKMFLDDKVNMCLYLPAESIFTEDELRGRFTFIGRSKY